MRDVTNENSEY